MKYKIMKYEKPQLVELSRLAKTQGVRQGVDGCIGGSVVIGLGNNLVGCDPGGFVLVD